MRQLRLKKKSISGAQIVLKVFPGVFASEHGYFGSLGSGVKFQFFGVHFTSTSRISMRVGAFDSSTLPLCGEIWN